ncbi:4-(cytidine 5'-diphospho)-2-C-methyl-D-erythritol kinase [bacterium]|nr:4-(cytidine 5'-diphospho)-2-C-methyl-D-erythritol kinase [bacterium]MBU1600183.1 4-(cytidine 5'-diphospho)-2-C-methyl-D-erythritol kinase [bacterium]
MINVLAPAKINLSLRVLNKREDGYHNIETVFQSISLYDKITITSADKIVVLPEKIAQTENIIKRVALLLLEWTGKKKGAKITLEKNIPIGGGLGGGSSDAAAVLSGLNSFWDLGVSDKDIFGLAERLGADVPYFLMKGTVLGEGIGARLTKLKPIPPCYFLLAYPKISISTKEVYESFNGSNEGYETREMLEAIERSDLFGIANALHNDLERVVFGKYPQLLKIKKKLISECVLNSALTGSGSVIFGIVEEKKEAERIQKKIESQDLTVVIAEPI